MTSATATCPFCNAELPPLATPPAKSHTACPRCGEPVPSERFPVQPIGNTGIRVGSPDPPPPAAPALDAVQRKRKTLLTVLAIMCGMAAMALTFALFTRGIRRERDPKAPSPGAEELAQRPADLLGLGYLPRGVNVVSGIQIAALTKEPGGADLLREPRAPLLANLLGVLDRVGLTLHDVDHIVAGTELKNLSFHITTAIVTRKPFDAARLKEAVTRQKVSTGTYGTGTLYRFTDLPQVPKLWCAAARVLVYTTLPTDELARIPANAKEPAATLTPAARKALSDRLSKQSRLWAVGDLEPAKDLSDSLPLIAGPYKEQAHLLSLVRTFAAGIALPEPGKITLTADFYTGVPAASLELRKYLDGVQVPGAKAQKVESPPADIEAAEAQWVTWQVRGDTAAMRELLGKLTLTPGKNQAKGP